MPFSCGAARACWPARRAPGCPAECPPRGVPRPSRAHCRARFHYPGGSVSAARVLPAPHHARVLGERGRPAAPGLVASESPALRPPPQSVDLRVGRRGELGPRAPPPAGQPRSAPHGPAPLGGERAAGPARAYQSRSGVGPQKKARARLLRLAASHPEGALGCEDETGGRRVAPPARPAWTPAQPPLRVGAPPVPPTAPDPTALACEGLRVQERPPQGVSHAPVWLRCVAERPRRALTVVFLTWVCAQVTAWGKTALRVGGEKASWHRSQAVRQWLRAHHQHVKREGQGLRIVRCPLPSTSPWLNPLEAHWVPGKRAVVAPTRLLTAAELVERVTAHCGCPYEDPLSIPQEVS